MKKLEKGLLKQWLPEIFMLVLLLISIFIGKLTDGEFVISMLLLVLVSGIISFLPVLKAICEILMDISKNQNLQK